MKHLLALTLALVAQLAVRAAPASAQTETRIDHATIGRYLEQIQASYYDISDRLPEEFLCTLESPELVASLPPGVRRAWGGGEILVQRTADQFSMKSSGIDNPGAQGLFDLALVAFQLRLGAEMAILQGYLPAATTAIAVGILASPLTHQAYERGRGDRRRFGLHARDGDHPVQHLAVEVSTDGRLLGGTLVGRDGNTVGLEIGSRKYPWSRGLWVVDSVDVTTRNPRGKVEVRKLELDLRQPVGREDILVIERLTSRVEDSSGRPIKKRPDEVNPISFLFSNCVID